MKRSFLASLSIIALLLQGCANDPPKVYPPAPVTPEYDAKFAWANLHSPIGVDKYSWLVPAVSDDVLYVAERNGVLSKLNLQSGATIWSKNTDYNFSAGPSISEGVLYTGTSKAFVVAVDTNTGEQIWSQQVSSEVLVPPLLKGDRVIVRTNDGQVFGLRSKDGKIVWTYDRNVPALTLRGNSTPVIVGSNVIVGFANGRLISLTLLDGKTNWETAISLPRGRTELERMVDIDGPLVEQNGIVYVSSYNGKVAAVSADSGGILWTRDISSHLGAMVDGNNVYLTDAKGKVWAFDKENGATLWMQDKLEERANTRPIVHNGKLVVGDVLGELYWLSLADGRIIGHLPHDKPSKMSGATHYVDEIDDSGFFKPKRDETAVIFEPRQIDNRLVVTYQNGVLATIISAN